MAYIASDAILDRLEEILDDARGSLRVILSTSYGGTRGDLPPGGLSEREERIRGVLTSKPFEVQWMGLRPHPQRYPETGSLQLYYVDIDVRIVRTLDYTTQVDRDLRRAVTAAALEDGDVIAQAFGWPNNLGTTNAGTATGMLYARHVRSIPAYRGTAEGAATDIVTVHTFEVTATSSPATAVTLSGAFLQEDGTSYILQEDGSLIQLEG